MDIEEDYRKESYVKNDESLYIGKSENINLIQWLISILYIIVLYGWAYFDIRANEIMKESSTFILINIVYFIIFLLLLILQIKAVNRAVKMIQFIPVYFVGRAGFNSYCIRWNGRYYSIYGGSCNYIYDTALDSGSLHCIRTGSIYLLHSFFTIFFSI